tara:strand:+ start:133 stop:339 length:207 start_codon:yes stop_codon:yes gene_type:complete
MKITVRVRTVDKSEFVRDVADGNDYDTVCKNLQKQLSNGSNYILLKADDNIMLIPKHAITGIEIQRQE